MNVSLSSLSASLGVIDCLICPTWRKLTGSTPALSTFCISLLKILQIIAQKAHSFKSSTEKPGVEGKMNSISQRKSSPKFTRLEIQ
jgi:hypothetical protein